MKHRESAFRAFSGAQVTAYLAPELDRLGVERAVIITSRSVVRSEGALEGLESQVGERLVGRWAGVTPHSLLPSVREAAEMLTALRADGVIAVGGGSAMVTARAAVILAAEQRDIRDLCTRVGPNGSLESPRLRAAKLPLWVVPTTPSTAMATAGSAVLDPGTGERLVLFDPKSRAQGVVLDDVFAATAPSGLVTSAALNAFAMAVEGLQACADDAFARALLRESAQMTMRGLRMLRADPLATQARVRLMEAALLCSRAAEHVGGGIAAALSHAAGPLSAVANGVIEAMLLPAVMRFNGSAAQDAIVDIGRLIDGSIDHDAQSAITALSAFLRSVDVPPRLPDVGIHESDFPTIIEHALSDWSLRGAPRTPTSADLANLLASTSA